MRCEPGPMAVAIEGMPVVYLTDRQDAPRRGGLHERRHTTLRTGVSTTSWRPR